MASWYTLQKYFNNLTKDQQVAILLYIYKAAWLTIGYFSALLWAVHSVYGIPTAVECRESHVEDFDPNGQLVHLIEVF